jgi:hypothetical protein
MRKPLYDNYKGNYLKIDLPSEIPSEGQLRSEIRKLKVENCYIAINICDNGCKLHEIDLDLHKNDDKDLFYAEMMKWSLTHSIAKINENFFLVLYLIPSKDGQTNITLDILDATYNRLMELKDKRMYQKLANWEARGIELSA